MDDELKGWLLFWVAIGLILLGIIVSMGSCEVKKARLATEALKAGVSGIDINVAIGNNADSTKAVLAVVKAQCKDAEAKKK
jgi:hypothetical protein